MSSITKTLPFPTNALQQLRELQDRGMDIARALHAQRGTPEAAEAFARITRSICESMVLETRLRQSAQHEPPPAVQCLVQDAEPQGSLH